MRPRRAPTRSCWSPNGMRCGRSTSSGWPRRCARRCWSTSGTSTRPRMSKAPASPGTASAGRARRRLSARNPRRGRSLSPRRGAAMLKAMTVAVAAAAVASSAAANVLGAAHAQIRAADGRRGRIGADPDPVARHRRSGRGHAGCGRGRYARPSPCRRPLRGARFRQRRPALEPDRAPAWQAQPAGPSSRRPAQSRHRRRRRRPARIHHRRRRGVGRRRSLARCRRRLDRDPRRARRLPHRSERQ